LTKISSVIGKILSSKTKVELLAFFEQNPWTIDTADGVAMRIGKTGEAVQEDLYDLETAGFLKKKYIGHVLVFQMNPPAVDEIRQLLSEYDRMAKKGESPQKEDSGSKN